MPNSGDVRVVLDEAELRAFMTGPVVHALILAAAERPVGAARSGAPKLSGEGAASIHAEAVLEGPSWTARISWDQAHYYMFFQEQGTKFLDARPFLKPSIQ